MAYRHETVRADYQDLASGMVLHSAPGFPAFPVRLASEMFQRALALRGSGPAVVWDPFCGSGYLLTVLTLLNRRRIRAVLASDIDEAAVDLAARNLALLSGARLAERAVHLREQAVRFDKPSYAEAARAAERLSEDLTGGGGDVPHRVHRADAFEPGELTVIMGEEPPGIVVTDVPYGEQTTWLGPHGGDGVAGMVRSLAAVLPADAVIALAVRGRKVPLDGLRPAASFKIGNRAVALIVPGRS